MGDKSSRLSGFHRLDRAQRLAVLKAAAGLDDVQLAQLEETGSTPFTLLDRLVENAIGAFEVPLGIATNMIVDGRELLVPMATEESSVIAAVGNLARRCRSTGGFTTSVSGPLMIGQVQLVEVPAPESARLAILERREEIARLCDATDPPLVAAGGGFRDLEVRLLDSAAGPMLIAHLVVDTRDAMGANAVNTMAEAVAPHLAAWSGGRAHLRILSNLADRRLARARAVWPKEELGGTPVVDGILCAYAFAAADPYRAATHNKGIMNGVTAVTLATGNDTRAVEAGAHAYAARGGSYRPLSRLERTAAGDLAASLELPLALGLVGGATKVHPTAQLCLKILGVDSALALSRVVVAVGLAQNVAALRALATTGIQRGHMALHAQNLAMAAGALGDEIDRVAEALVARGTVRQDLAETLLAELRAQSETR